MPYTNKIKLTVLHCSRVADCRITLGKVEDDDTLPFYFCAARDVVFIYEPPSDLTITRSIDEAAEAYAALVAKKARHIADHVLDRDANGIRVSPYKEEDCVSMEFVNSMYDKVFVLDPYSVVTDYDTGADQLAYCVKDPGNGEDGEFVALLSGEQFTADDDEFIGVLEDEDLPKWAKESLARLRERLGLEEKE